MLAPLLLGFVLGAGAILFALQNPSIVALRFFGWQFESSLALLIILAVSAGALLGMLFSIPSLIRSGFRIRALKKENKVLFDENQSLREWGDETAAHFDAQTQRPLDARQ